jgi:ribosome-associated protein
VGGRFSIPAPELRWRFDPSGGPGGQHANRSSTRVELSWDIGDSPSIPDSLRQRALEQLGSRAPGGVITVSVDETRSQWRNRALARRRLAGLLVDAIAAPAPERRPTRPGAAARQRRLEAKRRRAERKHLRRPPTPDD